jgi:hypothetical protein
MKTTILCGFFQENLSVFLFSGKINSKKVWKLKKIRYEVLDDIASKTSI